MSSGENGRTGVAASALTLGVLAAICAALVAVTHELTADRIEDNRQAYVEASLQPVLDGIEYDGRLSESTTTIAAPNGIPGRGEATIYRVYADGKPVAALFTPTARDGYSGPIRLLLGVRANGAVTRVRVIEHSETPGLGDRIESSKSDWLENFSGRSLQDPPREEWDVVGYGGEFDAISGATITSRAVVRAIRETLVYFETNREAVFEPGEQPQ